MPLQRLSCSMLYELLLFIVFGTTVVTTDVSAVIVSEFAGGQSNDVQMMIGVGLVKDSDAVFFQYVGEDASPRALTLPTTASLLLVC